MYISDGGCVRFPGFSDAVMPVGDGESTDDAGDAGSPSDATTAEAGDASEAESSSSVVVCASANDCYLKGPGTVYCCLDKVCAFSNDNTSIVDCTDADAQLIQASDYDQSCMTDSDCVAVSVGNACYPGFLNCSLGTINVGALAQYNADVAKTNATLCGVIGDCGVQIPCCRGGQCQTGDHCSPVSPGDAATDAKGGTGSGDTGTSDAPAGG
jgi:hypothetical protein